MPRCKMFVLSRPTAGLEAEYNDWYQNVHLKQVLAIPGFVSAQRFRLAVNLVDRAEAAPYAAIYEIDTDDLDKTLNELRRRAGGGEIFIAEALDLEGIFAAVYEEFGAPTKA